MHDGGSWTAALFRALADNDPQASLRYLFDRVDALSTDQQCSPEYDRFVSLMATVARHSFNRTRESLVSAAFQMVVERCVSSSGAEDAPHTGRSSPWQREYEQLVTGIAAAARRPDVLDLTVVCNEHVLARFPVTPTPFTYTIPGVQPGYYELRTDTGWRLWACDLKHPDLILSALRLAAQSRSTALKPTRRTMLRSTALLVSVFPGVETGSIRIEHREAGRKECPQ